MPQSWIYDPAAEANKQQELDDERRRRGNAKPSREQAARLSDIKRAYPWLTPGAAMSLAKQGLNAQSRHTREVARRAAERKKKKGFGWHSIGDFVGGVGDFVTPERAEDVIGSVVKSNPVKAATRTAFTGLQAGQELVAQGVRRGAMQFVAGKDPNAQRIVAKEFGITSDPDASLNVTTAGIALEQFLKDPDKVDLGSGFFPGGKVAEEQARRARAELSIAGHAATPGRLLAYTITEPGTTAYNWTSGLVDAAFVLGADPANIALGKLGKLRQGRKLIDPSVAGGIAKATRRTNIPELANAYLDGADGRKVVGWLSKETNPYKIYRAMGEKVSAEEAADLSRLTDPSDIVDYIRPKLGTSIRAKPYVANTLTRPIKPVDGFSAFMPEAVTKRLDGVRLLHVMPGRAVDPDNSTDVAVNMYRAAHNAKLGAAKAEEYFNLAANARGPIGRFNAVNAVQADIAASLVGGAARPKVRDGLTRMYRNYREEMSLYATDEIGNNMPVLGADIRGVDYALPTPHLYSEYINRAIPLPDARAIRRATSKYGRLLNYAGGQGGNTPIPVAALDFIFQDVWKPMQLIRGAWTIRVVGEEQIRMAAMNQKSLINHPIQAILWAVGRDTETGRVRGALRKAVPGRGRGELDVLGGRFDPTEELTAINQAMTRRGQNWRNRITMAGQVNVPQASRGYGEAGARELAKLHADPITRRIVAGLGEGDGVAVRTGNPLVDVKEWFWSGAGQKFRKEMAEAKGREALADSRQVADELIDSMHKRIQIKTQGRPDLLEVVASGKTGGVDDLVAHIDDLGMQGLGPRTYVGELQRSTRAGQRADHAVDSLFNVFMSRPTNFLSRSPAFRQFYWRRVEELIPAMDEAAQRALLDNARAARLQPKVLRRMEKTVNRKLVGDLTLDEADTYAKAFGLDETKRLLYDLTERSQFFDIARHIFPFGEAWGEVLKVWARIGTERPQTVRRAQVAIQGARGSGFFHENEHGEEVFNYPFTRELTEAFTGVPAPFTGRVQGLNIFSDNPLVPGFGPFAQIVVSRLLPQKSSWDAVRHAVSPFGEPEVKGGVFESFFPAWFQKFQQADKTPFGREDPRLWLNNWASAVRHLANTGEFDSQETLEAAATKAANRLYLLRGMAQFFAPSAPSPNFMTYDKDGHLITEFKLTEEFRKLQKLDRNNGTDVAVDTFLTTYGANALLYMQPKSEGYGPVSAKGLKWVKDHQEFVKRYPLTYSAFAPSDGGFNYDAYTQLIKNGEIKPLSKKEYLALGNNRVAAMIYRQAQNAVGEKISDNERVWLRGVKENLRRDYPGYDTLQSREKRVTERKIDELREATTHRSVSGTPVAQGIREYLRLRDQAQEEAERRGLASFKTAKRAANLRTWLRGAAEQISVDYAGFRDVFDYVFAYELADETEVSEQ